MSFITTPKPPYNHLIHYSQLNNYNPQVQTATTSDMIPTDKPIQNITTISIPAPSTPSRFLEKTTVSSTFPRDLPIDVQPIFYKSSPLVTTECTFSELRRKLPAKHRSQGVSSPIKKLSSAIMEKIFIFISYPELCSRTQLVCIFWKKSVPTKHLYLSQSLITDNELTNIIEPDRKSIVSLNLDGCTNITNAVLSKIAKLQNLRELNLSQCDISDPGLAELAKLQNLRKLFLTNCSKITDEGIAELAKLKNLEELDLAECTQITDEGIAELAKLKNLEVLFLNACFGFTDAGIATLTKLRKLCELHIEECTQLTDAGFAELAKLKNLEVLDLNGTDITDTGLAELTKLKKINNLVLDYCYLITNSGLAELAKLKNLFKLSLMGCRQITYAGFAELAKLKCISRLFLNFCSQITDTELTILAKIRSLRELHLRECTQITDTGIKELYKSKNLIELYLNQCPQITDGGIAQFRKLRMSTYEKSEKYVNMCKQLHACVLFPGINPTPLLNIIASYLSIHPMEINR